MGIWGDKSKFQSKDKPRLNEVIKFAEVNADYKEYRPVGNPIAIGNHWITINTKAGGQATFPARCLALDPYSMEVNGECPYCDQEIGRLSVEILQNVISREEQDNEPRKRKKPSKDEAKLKKWNGGKHHLMDGMQSTTWTPVRVLRLTKTAASKINNMISLNKHKTKEGTETFPPHDPKYGFDFAYSYDVSIKGGDRSSVNKLASGKLTKEELEYPIWKLDCIPPETMKEALENIKRLKKNLVDEDSESDGDHDTDDDVDVEDDDLDDVLSKSSKKKKPKKSKAGTSSKSKSKTASKKTAKGKSSKKKRK